MALKCLEGGNEQIQPDGDFFDVSPAQGQKSPFRSLPSAGKAHMAKTQGTVALVGCFHLVAQRSSKAG